MRIILLGAPGSGKGTQGQRLMARLNIPQISTGDLLRAAVAEDTALGRKAKVAMDAGQLVADEVVIGMIDERLTQSDAGDGFILDGFPRTQPQAVALDELLRRLGQPLDRVVNLEVGGEEIVKRLLARGRSDDSETTIRERLEVYTAHTKPLLDYYRERGLLAIVPGVGDMDAIFERVMTAIGPAPSRYHVLPA